MHNIESYSRYLNDLVKEGKFENVLLNFADNAKNFTKQEIAENRFLIKNLLKSYKEVQRPIEGLQMLIDFDVDIHKFNDQYVVNSYGWLLFSILKTPDSFTPDQLEVTMDQTADLLSKINILEEHFILLTKQLLSKIIQVEKRHSNVSVARVLGLLKLLKITTDSSIKDFIKGDPYITSGIIDLFRKSGHVERAFGFINYLGIEIDQNTSEQILNSYGWCLYTKLKQQVNEVDAEEEDSNDSFLIELTDDSKSLEAKPIAIKEELFDTILSSISLFSLKSEYSPFSKLFGLTLKAQKLKSNPNWAWVIEFLSLLDKEKLDIVSDSVEFTKNGRTKKVELSSDLENWYSYYTSALIKLSRYQECINMSKEALFRVEKFHYSNDLWFARRIALANKGLGNIQEAVQSLLEIEKRKPEWFIQKEISELYFEQGDLDVAKKFAIRGALGYGDVEKKDGLYFLIGQIFMKEGNKEYAYTHFLFSKLIREEQEWSIPFLLRTALAESMVETIDFDNSQSAYRAAIKIWRAVSPQNNGAVKV